MTPQLATPIDLRSDLMAPRSAEIAKAMAQAVMRPPAMEPGEDPDEKALDEMLAAELGVEATLLVPTCTMANQIAIRLHLSGGGVLATTPLSHVLRLETAATDLTGVAVHELTTENDRNPQMDDSYPGNGHPDPQSVERFCQEADPGTRRLVWIENTHMLTVGSVLSATTQARIISACKSSDIPVHLDGSRLWNAAVAQDVPMASLTAGCDTIAVSLNKGIGAPLGAVLAGSRRHIDEAIELRQAMSGEWRPIGPIAAGARAALIGWRERLETDAAMTRKLAAKLGDVLGEAAIHDHPTNLIFVNRDRDDADPFIEALERHGVRAGKLTSGILRFAIHAGIREREVDLVAHAVHLVDKELALA